MIKKLFSFKGRSGRQEFFIILAIQLFFLILIRILRQQSNIEQTPELGYALFTCSLLLFIVLYLRIAVTVRRLRDTGLSLYFVILPLLAEFSPFLGFNLQQVYFLTFLTLLLTCYLLFKKGI